MKSYLLIIVAVLIAVFGVDAQQTTLSVEEQFQKGMNVRALGPAGMSGRITSIAVHPSNENIMYVGAASGGVWKSENKGMTFKPIFDDMPVQSIGALAINPRNPDEIWVGTGEGNPRNSHNGGAGIFKSVDGGKNWEFKGLKKTRSIHRIIIHPHNGNVLVGAVGNAWRPNAERGVYQSTDGGDSWENVLFVNDTTGCAELVQDPSNPNKIWAAMWHHHREPWFFTSGGAGSGLYVSFDGGSTWQERTDKDGLPKGNLGRMGIAVSASNPSVMYVLAEAKKNGLYKSTDGGFTFKKVSERNIGNRPFYYAEIYVDPTDEHTLYNLYSLVSKSIDGGKTFQVIAPYSGIHPDHHAFWINPNNPNHLIDGNDGGLYESYDGGGHWRFIASLPLGQFYHINVDNAVPYNVFGGMQDNGSWVGPGFQWRSGGIRSNAWEEVLFGDGFDVDVATGDSNTLFAMYQGGHVYRIDRQSGQRSFIQPTTEDVDSLRFNWNAALCVDPHSATGLYFGSQFVHYSTDGGNTWQRISPDLTTNDSAKQQQVKSGGLTIDATRAENYTTLTAIAASPTSNQVIWAGSDDGRLHRTENKGKLWRSIYPKNAPKGAWVQQIRLTENEGEAFVVLNDYRRGDEKPYLFHTTNGGNSWVNLVANSKIPTFLWSFWVDKKEPNLYFVGSEMGLYYSFDGGKNWTRWTQGIPAAPISDMAYNETFDDLVVATFGRSVYVLDNISTLRSRVKHGDIKSEGLALFAPKLAIRAPFKSIQGEHFPGHTAFEGRNKPNGFVAKYWLRQEPAKDKEKDKGKKDDKKSKLYVYVLNATGDTVRSFHQKADTGMHNVFWNYRANGVHYPSRKKPKADANVPAGYFVSAGEYQIKVHYKSWSDSVTFQLRDAFNTVNSAQQEAYQGLYKEFLQHTDSLQQLYWDVAAITEKVSLVGTYIHSIDTLAQDSIKKWMKQLKKDASQIHAHYFVAKGFDGYNHVTPFINTRLGRVRNYLDSHYGQNDFESARQELHHLMEVSNPLFETYHKELLPSWERLKQYATVHGFDVFSEKD